MIRMGTTRLVRVARLTTVLTLVVGTACTFTTTSTRSPRVASPTPPGRVPSVVRFTEAEARATIEAAGYVAVVDSKLLAGSNLPGERGRDLRRLLGTVADQKPRAGSEYPAGGQVVIQVWAEVLNPASPHIVPLDTSTHQG
jgi:PASTA domain